MTPENALREQIRMNLESLGICPKTDDPQEIIKGIEKVTKEKVTGYKRAKGYINQDGRHIIINGWVFYY